MQAPDFKHNHIKAVAEIVVRNAWTAQLILFHQVHLKVLMA